MIICSFVKKHNELVDYQYLIIILSSYLVLDLLGNFVHTSLIGNYSILLKMTISLTSLFLKSTYALNVCGVGEAAPADA